MTSTSTSKAARVRASLGHPMIDGDSHIVEYTPDFFDFLKRSGGSDAVERFFGLMRGDMFGSDARKGWYDQSPEERRQYRSMRSPWWALPTKNTRDRCTSMLPRLYHERMDDFGLDFAVLYPTVGLAFNHLNDDEFRPLACHAFNEYTADCYREFRDRMTVAAVIPLHTPQEGIRELEHAKALGHKVALIPSYVRRPIPALAQKHPDLASRLAWLDSYAMDSEHDYDPFWRSCVDLGFAVASHSAGMGFDDRRSISNYMYNHMGHFAAAGEVLCKSLLMGGVTQRFPRLRVALLEGGVVNGVRLYSDILARVRKRSLASQVNLDPRNIDMALARDLFQRYGKPATLEKLDQLERTLHFGPVDIPERLRDDFAAMHLDREEDLRDRFIPHFYFGCEADDSLASIAFDSRLHPFASQVRAIMSFDLGHWDVTDMGAAAAEAYELVEHGLMKPDDFRSFAFTHAVQLYGAPDPDFFKGTAIEKAAAEELARAGD